METFGRIRITRLGLMLCAWVPLCRVTPVTSNVDPGPVPSGERSAVGCLSATISPLVSGSARVLMSAAHWKAVGCRRGPSSARVSDCTRPLSSGAHWKAVGCRGAASCARVSGCIREQRAGVRWGWSPQRRCWRATGSTRADAAPPRHPR